MTEAMLKEKCVADVLNNKKIQRSLSGYMDVLVFEYDRYAYENKKLLDVLHNIRLVFNNGEDCYTNGRTVVIGKEFILFKKAKNGSEVYKMAQGIIAHEVAHLLYTNFNRFKKFILRAPREYEKFSNLAKTIYNILEDYRIEARMSRESNYISNLFLKNRTEIIKNIVDSIETKNMSDDQSRVHFAINSIMVTLLNGERVSTTDSKARRLYREVLKISKAGLEEGTVDSIEEAVSDILTLFQDLEFNPNEVSKVYHLNSTELNRVLGVPRDEEDDEKDTQGSSRKFDRDRDSDLEGSVFPFGSIDITEVNHVESEDEEESEDLTEKLENMSKNYTDEKDNITSDIINNYRALDPTNIPESKVKELYDIDKANELGRPANVDLNIEEPEEKFDVVEYDNITDELSYDIKQTTRQLKNIIDHYESQVKLNQKSGRLNTSKMTRFVVYGEIDIFKKKRFYREEPKLNVSMLVDNSGSNGAYVSGTNYSRYILNQMMSVYFHEVLKNIEFRHSIYTFDSGYQENIKPIVTVDNCFDNFAGSNISSIGAKNANRDGYHIRLATKRLLAEMGSKNEGGVLIIMSDGLPNSINYYGTSAMLDVKKAVEEAEKQGVKVLGIFTGNEQENEYFPEMYSEHFFLNGSSIQDFPKVFKRVITEAYQDFRGE